MTTLQPWSASSRTRARPSPRELPVTTATLPWLRQDTGDPPGDLVLSVCEVYTMPGGMWKSYAIAVMRRLSVTQTEPGAVEKPAAPGKHGPRCGAQEPTEQGRERCHAQDQEPVIRDFQREKVSVAPVAGIPD